MFRQYLLTAASLLWVLQPTSTLQLTRNSGQRVLLVGPGFLQLNIAKACKAEGLTPIVVAPQKKLERFASIVNDPQIMKDSSIGVPDEGNLHAVVFCSEEAVFAPDLISTLLEWKDGFASEDNKPLRAVACAPASTKVSNEKSMGWMPILNNDKKEKVIWDNFIKEWKRHPISSGDLGTLVHFGSLLGGSVDGPEELTPLGLDEQIYKMSLENYRDMKERAFDRLRLGAQIIEGDAVNIMPAKQQDLEKRMIKDQEELEMFRSRGGYPEQDRACRHTVAQAVVQALLRPTARASGGKGCVPDEFTVLSKSTSELPTAEEWEELFSNPQPAAWPLP